MRINGVCICANMCAPGTLVMRNDGVKEPMESTEHLKSYVPCSLLKDHTDCWF